MKKKLVFKGKLLKLFTQRKKLPNGYLANLEIIEHPGAVLIIPFLSKEKVILLKQFRPVINSYIYELPAGTLDDGELPLSCARREIIEEIGYSAKIMKRLGVIFPVPGYSTEKITVYKAQKLKKEKIDSQKDEVISSFVVTRRNVKELFKKGRLVDSKTISAFCMCGWL
ncbi:MAG: NUDIX hydrolase [Omnitrophica bacterium]|nr:NUDIX hydrolase [Candidatus Omnitrophota bacterium]